MRIQVKLLPGSTKERNFLLLCNGNDIIGMNYASSTSAFFRFFPLFLLFLKLLIGVPSGNHNVLSARFDLMECFLNFVYSSEVSVSARNQDGHLDKLDGASVGFLVVLKPPLPHVIHLKNPVGAKIGSRHNPAWPAAAEHGV